jgi:hypothetical protein
MARHFSGMRSPLRAMTARAQAVASSGCSPAIRGLSGCCDRLPTTALLFHARRLPNKAIPQRLFPLGFGGHQSDAFVVSGAARRPENERRLRCST